ncbi:expansin EXLX1 family cellulose-binding protein [Streptomyces sp. NPDC006692]|uniref:expansin EXLX1 family cellulose-binding protein n=1 Tax=Streptomyces sp. NPDC006692 TaxID=3364758 RepID=UPI003682A59D
MEAVERQPFRVRRPLTGTTSTRSTERMGMRTTNHRAPRPRRGRAFGIPLAVLAVGVLACVGIALLPGSRADAGHRGDASVAAAPASVPSGSGSPTAATGAATASALPPSTSPPPSAPRTPTPTASSSPRAASLAGRIKPAVTYRGVATSYAAGDGQGSCLYGPSGDPMIAAMNHADYESAKACGAQVLVRAADGAAITVRIVNECPLPCAPGQLDLSTQAFAKLANPSLGRIPVSWTLLSPTAPGVISIRYKAGSSRWWCGVQVIGHRNPVAVLELRTANGWRRLPRTDYNYFLSTDGSGCGGTIRVTDIYGEQLTIDKIALKPDVAQPTDVQFARR